MRDNFILAMQEAMQYKSSTNIRLKSEYMNEFEEYYKLEEIMNKDDLRKTELSEIELTAKEELEVQKFIERVAMPKEKINDNLIENLRRSFKEDKKIKGGEKLLNIYMYSFLIYKAMNSDDFYSTENLYDLIAGVSGANMNISSALMDYDFDNSGHLDFEAAYMPNILLLEYLKSINKESRLMNLLKGNREVKSVIEENKQGNLIWKYDIKVIGTSCAFMEIQAILLLMEWSRYYTLSKERATDINVIHKIAKQMVIVFKDLLVNARIEKIIIDPAIASQSNKSGLKTTTGIKIFFALENFDNYCLRIDFPHSGEAYFHYNLHEPGRATAFPLMPAEYYSLKQKYGSLQGLFFKFEGKYWFRNDFMKKLYSQYNADENAELIQELERKFHDQAHYRMFGKNVTEGDMKQFIAEFATALSYMKFGGFVYKNTNQDDIDKEMKKIKLQEVTFEVLLKYLKIKADGIFENDKSLIVQEQEHLKSRFVDILFQNYNEIVMAIGSKEECMECGLKELLEMIYECCQIDN